MKYNPKINEDLARLEGLRDLHPLSPDDCVQGALQLMWELEQDLMEITGMDSFSLQPAAGAQGELLGIMITKAYFKQNNEKRTKILIPDSAHGTNPASAAMCRCETITIPSDSRGNMDIDKFKQSLTPDVGLVMLTNPNTLGLFEENYLPTPRIIKQNNKYILDYNKRKSVGRIRSFNGNFSVLVRAYSYIKSWGTDIRKVSEHAVLNANYLLTLLKDVYELSFDRTCAHEFVLSSNKFGNRSAMNIAKRLLDYGFHPPTVYFPLIVREALMIAPTETESKETLDRFVMALRSIADEIKENPIVVKDAPHTTSIGRLDEVAAARRPNLRWVIPSRPGDENNRDLKFQKPDKQ